VWITLTHKSQIEEASRRVKRRRIEKRAHEE
jgi:hypothetical protein